MSNHYPLQDHSIDIDVLPALNSPQDWLFFSVCIRQLLVDADCSSLLYPGLTLHEEKRKELEQQACNIVRQRLPVSTRSIVAGITTAQAMLARLEMMHNPQNQAELFHCLASLSMPEGGWFEQYFDSFKALTKIADQRRINYDPESVSSALLVGLPPSWDEWRNTLTDQYSLDPLHASGLDFNQVISKVRDERTKRRNDEAAWAPTRSATKGKQRHQSYEVQTRRPMPTPRATATPTVRPHDMFMHSGASRAPQSERGASSSRARSFATRPPSDRMISLPSPDFEANPLPAPLSPASRARPTLSTATIASMKQPAPSSPQVSLSHLITATYPPGQSSVTTDSAPAQAAPIMQSAAATDLPVFQPVVPSSFLAINGPPQQPTQPVKSLTVSAPPSSAAILQPTSTSAQPQSSISLPQIIDLELSTPAPATRPTATPHPRLSQRKGRTAGLKSTTFVGFTQESFAKAIKPPASQPYARVKPVQAFVSTSGGLRLNKRAHSKTKHANGDLAQWCTSTPATMAPISDPMQIDDDIVCLSSDSGSSQPRDNTPRTEYMSARGSTVAPEDADEFEALADAEAAELFCDEPPASMNQPESSKQPALIQAVALTNDEPTAPASTPVSPAPPAEHAGAQITALSAQEPMSEAHISTTVHYPKDIIPQHHAPSVQEPIAPTQAPVKPPASADVGNALQVPASLPSSAARIPPKDMRLAQVESPSNQLVEDIHDHHRMTAESRASRKAGKAKVVASMPQSAAILLRPASEAVSDMDDYLVPATNQSMPPPTAGPLSTPHIRSSSVMPAPFTPCPERQGQMHENPAATPPSNQQMTAQQVEQQSSRKRACSACGHCPEESEESEPKRIRPSVLPEDPVGRIVAFWSCVHNAGFETIAEVQDVANNTAAVLPLLRTLQPDAVSVLLPFVLSAVVRIESGDTPVLRRAARDVRAFVDQWVERNPTAPGAMAAVARITPATAEDSRVPEPPDSNYDGAATSDRTEEDRRKRRRLKKLEKRRRRQQAGAGPSDT